MVHNARRSPLCVCPCVHDFDVAFCLQNQTYRFDSGFDPKTILPSGMFFLNCITILTLLLIKKIRDLF